MPYSPTDWTDGSTLVDATKLDKIEAGLVAAEEKALKGAVNGYASLDSGSRVPTAQGGLPTVVNGQWLKGVGGAAVWTALTQADAATPRSTTLPGSPVDGQEHVLTDSLTAPTYNWCFRYNAGSASTYKWEFVGGAPLPKIPGTVTTVNPGGVWGAFADALPVFVAPRSGDYLAIMMARYYLNAAGTAAVYLGVANASVSATPVSPLAAAYLPNQITQLTLPVQTLIAGVNLGQTLQAVGFSDAAVTTNADHRSLTILPVRCS